MLTYTYEQSEILVRPQLFYFLFYGFSRPISDVGGRKK